jgi:hypothetical protein
MSVKRSDILLNTVAHREARDQFIHHLNEACRREGWRPYEALGNWLDAAFRSMRSATLQFRPEDLAKNEAEYARIVKRCRYPQETVGDLAKMLGACVLALEAAPVDFIGPIFGEVAASSQLGQFFTPWHLSRVIAELIIEDPRQMLQKSGRKFLLLQEPACGVGGMTLAACEVLREKGFDLARQVHWSMVDIDYQAHCAAYIQINLCGISASVFHGNTLSLQTWLATPTLSAVVFAKRLTGQPQHEPPTPVPSTTEEPAQLSLFLEAP